MADDLVSRLREALIRLRTLDRDLHRHPVGTAERAELERQVEEQRERVNGLAAQVAETSGR